jgi:hypothetical protein
VARAEEMQIEMIRPRHRNPPSGDSGPNHWECWLRDPKRLHCSTSQPGRFGGWFLASAGKCINHL